MLRNVFRWLAVLVVGVALSIAISPTARADSSDDDSITRYDVRGTLRTDGSLDVTLDFDFDFGSDEGHGPYLVLPERMAIEGDRDHWRSLPISEITASSKNAPAQTDIEREGGAVLIKIGDPDVEVKGTQTYHVTYTIGGVVNPKATGSGLDELSWNAVGDQWEIPLSDVSVTITTPAEIERVGCFTGSDYGTPCREQPTKSGRSATFAPGVDLEPGDGLQVVAGMPAGSFPGVQPILTERYTAARVFGLNPVSGGVGVAVLAAGAILAVRLVRRIGGDLRFAGIAPGQQPAAGETASIERDRAHPVAVQFHPPQGVTPGQIGVLTDATADQKDVTATVIDLATRGYLRIEETGEDADDWQLVATDKARDGLRPYESRLLADIFAKDTVVNLKRGGIVKASGKCQQALYREVTDELGWYRGNPSTVRSRWILAGVGILVIGIVLIFALGFTLRLGFVGLGVALLGVLVAIMAIWAPGRTAVGTAVHDQALGFKEYLKTAEADQIKFEEGVDIFSRYLPYAMIWGLAERWTKIFAELARRGVDVPTPNWYVGAAVWSFSGSGDSPFVDAINGFDSAATTAMTASSSGGSGFSGGGGVGGGGGGGW
ncbi:Uncharacterized membrane protein [Microlunatus soli]|uniref:Uncharacterized membrane protein n=1 Tax=Microlunatus soli TaxID=630515 RepID=A0A1H1UFE1_9ACTN|nr:Uncharacterized membrane protein [Microlunatus soli]